LATDIYKSRESLRQFFERGLPSLASSFAGKVEALSFFPILKIQRGEIESSLLQYLKKNRQRDILIRKTHIGPHIDDFEIQVNGTKNLIHFASRGEVKSILLGLKFLAVSYIEKITEEKPLFLVDDLLSELDERHRTWLLEKFS